MTQKVVAIVPGAGIGKRFGPGTNKPFAVLAGKPLLAWVLETLESLGEISEIIPVIRDENMGWTTELIDEHHITKVRRIAPGGKERQDSVYNGLQLVGDEESVVLVHDGARPLLEPDHIKKALEALEGCDGVVVGVPVKDTVKEASDGVITRTCDRSLLWAIQTPQVFRYRVLHDAYEKAKAEAFYATDDSALVERYGGTVRIVQGSYMNIKVTTPEDLPLAELFIRMRGQSG
ncbi:MAG: 2-C-methyl-D-erythritol 4-phosphate cytidylyltransferase [Thermodesulfovibrio sp.]|nr:2-C-methyl-D-erythritol 4-phosphate cytidylyltransferase [Thermodesulfovibrio sp.]